jgi:Zn ribbon nucleic-acid-binding protein
MEINNLMILEAKCPQCNRKAQVDNDMSEVKCGYCGFHTIYDTYIEIMKNKAVNMADEFNMNLDK